MVVCASTVTARGAWVGFSEKRRACASFGCGMRAISFMDLQEGSREELLNLNGSV